jgi:DNA-binding IclR family transcriptional regulator
MVKRPTAQQAPKPAAMTMRYEELRSDGQHWTLSDTERSGPPLVPAVHKAVQVLSFINAQPRGVTLSAIAEATSVTKSHCFSILRTLVHHGWLHFNPDLKSYELGAGILQDVSSIMLQATPLLIINKIVQSLPLRTQTSCILSEPHVDGGFVVVEKANAPGKLEISYPVGHHYPRDTSAHMKAMLAWLEPAMAETWLSDWIPVAYTPATITGMDGLWEQLELTRKRGYALSIDEFTIGIGAIAMPIFDSAGQVVFILDCVGLTPDISSRQLEIAGSLIAAVGEIHAAINGHPPPGFPTAPQA